jgi:hypothetical protein
MSDNYYQPQFNKNPITTIGLLIVVQQQSTTTIRFNNNYKLPPYVIKFRDLEVDKQEREVGNTKVYLKRGHPEVAGKPACNIDVKTYKAQMV